MNKYLKRKQNRLKDYDYSTSGYYFVTICTQDRMEKFGSINNGEMILNESGEIVKNTWLEIPSHFDNTNLDQLIIMPNHIHGIIIIKSPVGNGHARSVNKNNLSIIIGAFKSV